MKCANCENEDLIYVEETYDKRKGIINLVTFILVAVLTLAIILTYKKSSDIARFINLFSIILIPLILIISKIYLFVKIKTSRTKIICKNCGMWWYIDCDKPKTIIIDDD